nr:hypothetical protein [uncultured Flavobacterium sp.]
MKKIKQLSLILFLSFGLFACEAEKVNEDIVDGNIQGKQIFRCEVDGVTRVTDSVSVTTNGRNVRMTAYFLSIDEAEKANYKYDTFSIVFNQIATGNYISSLGNMIVDESMGISSAAYTVSNRGWVYSTNNFDIAYPGNPADLINLNLQTGILSINSINEKAEYFEGNFNYDLYAPVTEDFNPNNTIPPLRIKNGYFQYIKY